MLEPPSNDPISAAPDRRWLIIAAWLGAAILVGAGFGYVVTAITVPVTRADLSPAPSPLGSQRLSARPSPTGSPSMDATHTPTVDPASSSTTRPTDSADFADLRLDFDDANATATVGQLWDAELARSVAQQLGVDVASLQMRVVRTLTSHELPPGWTAITVRYSGGSPVHAVGGYLSEYLRRPGSRAASGTLGEHDRILVIGEDWALGWSDELLLLMAFDVEPYLDASPDARQAMPNPHLLIATVAENLLPQPAPLAAGPSPTPPVSFAPEPTAAADPGLEAALPTSVLGQPQELRSFAWITAEQAYSLLGGLHPWLLRQFELEASDASLALGSGSVSNFTMWAHRLRGVSGDEMLGAYLGEQFAGLTAGWERVWEGREVDGRRYLVNESWALYAQDDILYWILYFDFGDCFDDCDYDTRPPFDEIVEHAISAIPGGD